MNTDWAFYRGDVVEGSRTDLDDSGWIPVALPHIMQLEMKHCGGNSIYDGIGWYRRYFKLPAKYKDKRVIVSFEGVMTNCDVYLNGQKVTEHHGGYMGFVADLTDRIDWNGNNVLAVRVSAEPDPLTPPGKPQDKMDFYYYSGIYRDVRMVITDKVYITDPLEEDLVAVLELPLDRHRLHLVEHGEEFVPEHANALLRNQVHLPVGAQGVEPVLEIAVVEDQVGRRDRLHPPDILPAVAPQFRGELQLLEGPHGGVAHFVLVKPFEELEPVQVVVFAVELRRQRIGRRGKFGRGV